MTPTDLIEHLASLNVVLSVDRGRLLVDSPMGVITPDLRETITNHKATIIEMLAGPPESEVRQRWVIRDCNRRLRAARIASIVKK